MITRAPAVMFIASLLVLSVAGEFPAHSLHLLGSVRSLESLVHRLERPQQFRTEMGADLGLRKLVTVSGKRERRTIRLYKNALPLLDVLHPDALEQYMATTGGHRFSGSEAHIQRNHRVAETVAVCEGAGLNSVPMCCQLCRSSALSELSRRVPASISLAPSNAWTAPR